MTPSLHCLASNADEALRFDSALVCDSALSATALAHVQAIWLPHQDAARARTLLLRGARRVLLGDAAVVDVPGVVRLAGEFGLDRVGLFARARRLNNRWSLETRSNADFKTLTPSVCEPDWEVLRSDGTSTGIRASHWIASMTRAGAAGSALVSVDIEDDCDLNLCAGLVELLGERICFAPATQSAPALYEWVEFGQVRSMALPPLVYARRAALLAKPVASEAA